jgi:allantoin racemase
MVEADNAADAFVIACYSDPGLHLCREGTRRPVFGIAECAVLTALARGDRFGVIAIAQKSIRRHARYLRQMGLIDRLAGERPLGVSVAESASEGTLARMVETGRALIDEDGADVVIMGCAGMARHRRPLEDALGVPVIDPTQAAVAMAIGTVQAGLQDRSRETPAQTGGLHDQPLNAHTRTYRHLCCAGHCGCAERARGKSI